MSTWLATAKSITKQLQVCSGSSTLEPVPPVGLGSYYVGPHYHVS